MSEPLSPATPARPAPSARPRPRPSAAQSRRLAQPATGEAAGPAVGAASAPTAGPEGYNEPAPESAAPSRLPVSELLAQRAGAASPFGDDLKFPLPAGALAYRHPQSAD